MASERVPILRASNSLATLPQEYLLEEQIELPRCQEFKLPTSKTLSSQFLLENWAALAERGMPRMAWKCSRKKWAVIFSLPILIQYRL